MAENKFRLRILTPDKIKVDEDVGMVIMRCTTGAMGIMAGHEPRSAVLDYGVVRIISNKNEYGIAVFGGIAEMKNNVLTILTSEAQTPGEINVEEVQAALKAAEQHDKETDLEIAQDQVSLRRALVQLEVSSFSCLSVASSDNDSLETKSPNLTI